MRKTIVLLVGGIVLLAVVLAVAEEAPPAKPDLAALTASCVKGDKEACAAAQKLHLELAEKLRADIARVVAETTGAGDEPGRMAKVDEALVAQRKKELEKMSISALLGTAGGSDSSVIMSGVLASDVDAAFAGTGGVVKRKGSARSAEIKKPKGRDGVGDLKGESGGAVGGGSRKSQKKVRAMTSLKIATGRAGNQDVSKTLKRRMSAMKQCYELLLKRDPNMPGGRVDVSLTIAKSGRVVEAEITRNATGSAELTRCIKGKLKRLRFKPPEEELETGFSITFKSN